jgi:hypothetical protein
VSDRFASPSERVGSYQQQHNPFQGPPSAAPNAPQPYVDRPQFEADNRAGQNDRSGFPSRPDRQGGRFSDRGPRPDRPFGERTDGYRDNRQSREGRPREFRPYREASPQLREADAENAGGNSLPSFITGEPKPNPAEVNSPPVSESDSVSASTEATDASSAASEASPGDGVFPSRGRRRRLRSPYGFNVPQAARDDVDMQNPSPVGDETE